MQVTTFRLETSDKVSLFVYRWLPETRVKAVIQIAHGWAEHAGRYARLADALCCEGYAVYANEHRRHGQTARTPEEVGWFAEHHASRKCLADLRRVNRHIAEDHPCAPIVLICQSM